MENRLDGSFRTEANHGALQGAAMAEIFERFETAELHADWAAARHPGLDVDVDPNAVTPPA